MLIVWVVYPRSIPLEEPAAPLGAKRQPLRSDDADHHLTGANRLVDGLPPGSTRDDAVDVQKYVVLVELLAKSVTDPPRGPANVTSSVADEDPDRLLAATVLASARSGRLGARGHRCDLTSPVRIRNTSGTTSRTGTKDADAEDVSHPPLRD